MDQEIDIDPKFLNDPLFQRVMKDALAIQDRFSAEPVYAKTGKGYLKSVGVAELQRIKETSKSAPLPANRTAASTPGREFYFYFGINIS